MKKAKISGIAAIYVACPNCGEDCENKRGSLLITPEDEEVSCVSCMATWAVDPNAFKIVSRKKYFRQDCTARRVVQNPVT